MGLLNNIRSHVEKLKHDSADDLTRWGRLVLFQVQLWPFCLRRLRENNATAMSAALSFRTIFAMIPTLVLALLVAKSLNALQDTHSTLQRIFEATGIAQIVVYEVDGPAPGEAAGDAAGQGLADSAPAATAPADQGSANPNVSAENETTSKGVSLADQIQTIADSLESKLTLGRIGPVGAALLIWSALTLLTTIERSLNRIYGARRSRALHRRIMLYWAALTLGPVALAAAFYLARQMTQHLPQDLVAAHVLRALAWASEVAVGIVLLALLYKFMPNTRVSFSSALTAALVAVLLWVAAKWAFSLYIQAVVGKRSLYGALGLLPLFFLWLNFSWLIFGQDRGYSKSGAVRDGKPPSSWPTATTLQLSTRLRLTPRPARRRICPGGERT